MSVVLAEKPNRVCCFDGSNSEFGPANNKSQYFFGQCSKCGSNHIQDRLASDFINNFTRPPFLHRSVPSISGQQTMPVLKYFELSCDQVPVDHRYHDCNDSVREIPKINTSSLFQPYIHILKRNGLTESDHDYARWLDKNERMNRCTCMRNKEECFCNNIRDDNKCYPFCNKNNHTQTQEFNTYPDTQEESFCYNIRDDNKCCLLCSKCNHTQTQEFNTHSNTQEDSYVWKPNPEYMVYVQECGTNTEPSCTNTRSTQSDHLPQSALSATSLFNKDKAVMVTSTEDLIPFDFLDENCKYCNKYTQIHEVEKKFTPKCCLLCSPSKVDKCL